jgi:signal transduction histidine kinase
VTLEWFLAVAERLTGPLLLLSPVAVVLACNRAAQRAIGAELDHDDLAARADDPEGFRRYIALASGSSSALPGAFQFRGGARWRCDASVIIVDGERLVVLQLRSASELDEQISRLQAEIRRREVLECERQLLLDRERDARADAERANRFKDELLGSISHELRTPLHAITGWIAVLRESPEDRELFGHAIEIIERNLSAQLQLVEDLVDASLAINGRLQIERHPVDLEQVIRDTVEVVRVAVDAKQQHLEVIASPGRSILDGDRNRLLQVVWNLLSNAIKYTPKGGAIRVELRRARSQVELAVSDTGMGIAPELLPHVFDRFRRGDGTTTRHHGGLGLGLAIVRHIVELHGGEVMAHSDGLGRGATITVNLPVPVLRSSSESRPVSGDGHAPLSGVRTLLVEDHDDSRELLASILRTRGATVIAVDRSAAAQDEFRNSSFDIVVSDIEMPEEDGFALMRKLRALERELERSPIPAVAVSAHSLGDARLRASNAGYQAFLAKPLRPAELVATISNLVEQR